VNVPHPLVISFEVLQFDQIDLNDFVGADWDDSANRILFWHLLEKLVRFVVLQKLGHLFLRNADMVTRNELIKAIAPSRIARVIVVRFDDFVYLAPWNQLLIVKIIFAIALLDTAGRNEFVNYGLGKYLWHI